MRDSSFYTAVNLAAGGRLRAVLARMTRNGLTFDEMAAQITTDTQVPVSREWVRQQCKRLGITRDGAA